MDDTQREHTIALYLASESDYNLTPKEVDTKARTTPYPEMAEDLLKLIRHLDKSD